MSWFGFGGGDKKPESTQRASSSYVESSDDSFSDSAGFSSGGPSAGSLSFQVSAYMF